MGIERRRVTEVYAATTSGGRVGSGYLLGDHLVLTARHVVEPSTSVEVRTLGRTEWVGASVVWSDEASDAALLHVDGGALGPAGAPPRWGAIGGQEAVAVSAVGFAWAQARPDGPRDCEQLFGHLAALSGAKGARYSVSVTTSAPQRPGRSSGWEGMSGAALFAGPYLVGVVVVDPARFGPDRVVATPAAVLLADAGFRDLVGAQDTPTTVGSRFRLEVAADLSVPVVAPYRDLPPAFGPAAVPVVLLAPEYGIVPFLGREAELAELARWCEAEGPLGVRVITGAGGSGKTRLAAEACVAATARGWVAGFADARVPGGATALELEDCTLLVVDEADTNVDLLAGLISQLRYTPTPARVLLVARRLGLWFDQLGQEVPYLEALSGVAEPISVDGAALEEEQRDRHFAAAAAAFAPRLGVPIATDSPWSLAEPAFATPLLVHMSALVAATGTAGERAGPERNARGEVLDGLLARERQRWRSTAATAGLADLGPEVVERAVAVASLVGADDETEATLVLEAVVELASPERRGKVARWLHELYPGEAWLNSLKPDLLVAHHLARTLPGSPDLVIRLFDRALHRRRPLLAVLVRAGSEEPALESVLRHFTEERLGSVVKAATEDLALAPTVARLCQLAPVPELATVVVDSLPLRSTPLAALGAVLQEQAVGHHRALADANPDAFLPDLGRALNNLSVRLAGVGRPEAGLAPIEEAVSIYRALTETNPDAFLPYLALSLNNLSVRLAGVGRREVALAPIEEAVSILRALAEASPAAFLPDLADSLSTQSTSLADLGDREAALAPIDEAVGHYRALAEVNPDAFLTELARSLNDLSVRLRRLGRREAALVVIEEAVGYYRALAETDPDAFLLDLALSLDSLSNGLAQVGRRAAALAPLEDAVRIRRALAEADPGAFLPALAGSLNDLSVALGDLGRPEVALAAIEEAVSLRRTLVEANREAFGADLADSLTNLSLSLRDLGRREAALAAIEEAVDRYRALAEANPDAFVPNLALSLTNLSGCLAEVGRREEALAAIEEAVDRYRALAEAKPEAFLPALAASLGNRSASLGDLGRREAALAPIEDAVSIHRALVKANPEAFGPDLAESLTTLSVSLRGLGRREAALAAIEEAVDHYWALAEANPEGFLPSLALSLSNLSVCLGEVGRREEALAAIEEAVDLRRALVEADPEAFGPDLAESLTNLSVSLRGLGRQEAALAAIEEAVNHYRALAEADPDVFLPNLALSLSNLSVCLAETGRHEAALAPIEEAVSIRRALVETNPEAFGPDLADSLTNLSVSLAEFGDQAAALAAIEEAVDHYRALLETNPDAFLPNLALALTNLSVFLADQGRQDEADVIAREAESLG